MHSQLLKYNLSLIDISTSRALSKAESERSFCLRCHGLDHCQYGPGQRGFKPHISVIENSRNGHPLREIYLALEQCQFRLERNSISRNKRLFQSSCIPEEYDGLCLSSLTYSDLSAEIFPSYKALFELIKNLEDNTGSLANRQLYLQGPPSSGKTYLSSLAGNEAISRGKTVMYKTMPEFLLALRLDKDSYPQELKQIDDADLLILEDVSGEIPTYCTDQILMIVDRRQRQNRALIVTGHDPLDSLMLSNGQVGQRLRNRLKRMNSASL